MDRRDFIGLAPRPAGAGQTAAKRMSRAARAGFFPNVPLVTHTGRSVLFYDDLIRDRTVLLHFFLVRCTDGICPVAIGNLRKVQDLLAERMGRDIFFYSISLQPGHDTPEVLRAYAEGFDVKPGWLFLTGKEADVEHLRRRQGYADPDPEIDRDPANHIGMARYGDDALERWGAVSVRSSPQHIVSSLLTLAP